VSSPRRRAWSLRSLAKCSWLSFLDSISRSFAFADQALGEGAEECVREGRTPGIRPQAVRQQRPEVPGSGRSPAS
jgi:hypothetical protein